MIAVDIGATNLLIGVVQDDQVAHRIHQPIADRSFNSVVGQLSQAINEMNSQDLKSVGIAVAGSVDVTTGEVVRAQNLDWNDVPLAQAVSEQINCQVVIENDVTAAAWGEFQFGAGTSCNSMFAVWIGTGIGGGLILQNNIWRGPLGTGGEFGMSISELDLDAEARVLEAFGSRSGFQRLTSNPYLSTKEIAHAFQTDPILTQYIENGASRIGTSIANVVTLLSLDTVVFGGGLIEALGEPFIDLIRKQFEVDVFPKQLTSCVFNQTILGPDAGLLGVASLAEQQLNKL